MKRTHSGTGEKCQMEGAEKKNCYGLTTAPISHPTVLLSRGDHNEGVESEKRV